MSPSNGITSHGKTNFCGEATKKPKNRSSTKDRKKWINEERKTNSKIHPILSLLDRKLILTELILTETVHVTF